VKTYRVIVTIDMVMAESDLSACIMVANDLKDVPIAGYPREFLVRAVEGSATEIQAREIEELQRRIQIYEEAMRGRP
jgi:hypothetical protein